VIQIKYQYFKLDMPGHSYVGNQFSRVLILMINIRFSFRLWYFIRRCRSFYTQTGFNCWVWAIWFTWSLLILDIPV